MKNAIEAYLKAFMAFEKIIDIVWRRRQNLLFRQFVKYGHYMFRNGAVLFLGPSADTDASGDPAADK